MYKKTKNVYFLKKECILDLESGGQDHLFFFLRGRVDEQSRRFHQITFAHEAVFLGVNLATIFHGSQNCEERMNQKKREEIRGPEALFISVRWLGWLGGVST